MIVQDTHPEDPHRIAAYENADIVVIGYSTVDPRTLESVQARWIEEVRQYAPNAIVTLAGLKMDLKATTDPHNVVNREEAEHIKTAIGAVALVECSGLTQENARRSFEVAVPIFFERENGQRQKGAKCLVS
jgi:GTPase SAR1 family protein